VITVTAAPVVGDDGCVLPKREKAGGRYATGLSCNCRLKSGSAAIPYRESCVSLVNQPLTGIA
jgi:hypothetical protein